MYGESWPRLQRLKQKIDPDNMFRNSGWPRPGAERDSAASAFFTGQPSSDGKPNAQEPNGSQPELTDGPTAEGSSPSEPKLDKGKARAIDDQDGERDVVQRIAALDDGPVYERSGQSVEEGVVPAVNSQPE